MRTKIITFLALCSSLLASSEDLPIEGKVVQFRREADWDNQHYYLDLDLYFEAYNARYTYRIETDLDTLVNFQTDSFLVVEETPLKLLYQAQLTLIDQNSQRRYETSGHSVTLTRQDYGLMNENQYMVVGVDFIFPSFWLDLNDGRRLHISPNNFLHQFLNENLRDQLSGSVVEFIEEQFIPEDPGSSFFIFYSDILGEFKHRDRSQQSHWEPSQEMLNHVSVLTHIGYAMICPNLVRTTAPPCFSYAKGHIVSFSDGRRYLYFGQAEEYHSSMPTWGVPGDPWVFFSEDGAINLNNGDIIRLEDLGQIKKAKLDRKVPVTWNKTF